jgi:hypothetical protein
MVSGGEDRRLDMDMAARRPARTRRRLRGSLWTGQRSFARRLNGTDGASHDDSKGWSEGGVWAPWMKRGARRQVEQRFLPRSLRTLDLFDLPRAVLQLQRRRRVEPLEPSVLWFLILPTKMTSWVGKGAH